MLQGKISATPEVAEADETIGRSAVSMAAFFALVPAAAVGGGLLLAPLHAVIALLAWPFKLSPSLRSAMLWPTAAILAFAVFVAGSILWSPVQRPEQALKIVAVLGFGLVFVLAAAAAPPRGRALIAAAGAAAVVVLVIALTVEMSANMPLNRLAQPTAEAGVLARNPGKGVSILVVFVWGLIAAYGDGGGWRRLLAFSAFAAAAVLSPQFDQNANMVAFAAGSAAFAFAWAAPAFAMGVVAGGLSAWMLAAPFLTPLLLQLPGLAERMPMSWQMRLEIWRFALEKIAEKPITGWGLDGARHFTGTLAKVGDLTFPALPLDRKSVV